MQQHKNLTSIPSDVQTDLETALVKSTVRKSNIACTSGAWWCDFRSYCMSVEDAATLRASPVAGFYVQTSRNTGNKTLTESGCRQMGLHLRVLMPQASRLRVWPPRFHTLASESAQTVLH